MLILLLIITIVQLLYFDSKIVSAQETTNSPSVTTTITNIPTTISADLNSTCPIGWYNFRSSCYKYEKGSLYKKARDTCGKYRRNNERLGYISIIESDDEMNFILSAMKVENATSVYVGANNLKTKDRTIVWERKVNDTIVDEGLFCIDSIFNTSVFACGVLQNYGQRNSIVMQSLPFLNRTHLNFCLNISNCLQLLPFFCEINCTNQESQCYDLALELNLNITRVQTPCMLNTHRCENNSTCISNSTDNYTCHCLPGFNGTRCEKDERPCLPHKNRCKNNSTCTQIGWKYNCTCLSGFEGTHCEVNTDDCVNHSCYNGAECVDGVNAYECNCGTYYYGELCQHKHTELVIKEQVSRSFSVLAIAIITLTYGFFVSLDALRYVFHIEPDSLSKERQLIRKKKIIKKIMRDMKNKRKRKKYNKMARQFVDPAKLKDAFILKLEKTFKISYDYDLYFIDDNISITNPNYTAFINKSKEKYDESKAEIKIIFADAPNTLLQK